MSYPVSPLNEKIRAALFAWKATKQICLELRVYPKKVNQIAAKCGLHSLRITEDERRIIEARRKGIKS